MRPKKLNIKTEEQKRVYATERTTALRTVAKVSHFIRSVNDLRPGPVVLYGRESSESQRRNLPPQLDNLRTGVEKCGFWVVAVFSEIVPGWESVCGHKWGRPEFEGAILAARDAKAVVVAESVERFRRSWHPKWKKGQPQPPLTVFDMRKLMDETDGVPLAALIHPDAPASEVRSRQTKRGQAGKGNFGGRPLEKFPKKARRLAKKPKAIALRQQGLSIRAVGRELKVPSGTIRDWLKK